MRFKVKLFLLLLVLSISSSLAPFLIAPAEAVEIELMLHPWANPSVLPVIEEALSRFEKQNPDIKVTVTGNTSQNPFLVRYAGGVAPDVVLLSVWDVGAYGDRGVIAPLDDPIQKSGLRAQIVGDMWTNGTWRGKTYGVPAIEQGPRLGMVWNLDMLNDAGLAVNNNTVMNWDTFFNYADKLTRINSNGVITQLGYDPRNGQNSRLYTVAPLWDAVYFPMDEEPSINQPNLIKMVETIGERIYAKYASWKFNLDWYDYFCSGKVATANLGIYAPGEISNRNKNLNYIVTWPPNLSLKKVQQITGWVLSVPNGVKNPDLSFRLIEFLATDVSMQSGLFEKAGFLGGGIRFISKLGNELRDANKLWYTYSMSTADYIDAVRPDPLMGKADSLFMTAATRVWAGKDGAPAALEEANRLFIAELKKVGRLN